MARPSEFNTITVIQDYVDFEGKISTGFVEFEPPNTFYYAIPSKVAITPKKITAVIDPASGRMTAVLPFSDDPDIVPHFSYHVTENVDGMRRERDIEIPIDLAPGPVRLYQLLVLGSPFIAGANWLTKNMADLLYQPKGAIGGGDGGTALSSYTQIQDLPDYPLNFPPQIGSTASTAVAGNDARLSDRRVPIDGTVTDNSLSAALKTAIAKANASMSVAEVDARFNNLIGAAPLALDTLVELAARLQLEASEIDALVVSISNRATVADLNDALARIASLEAQGPGGGGSNEYEVQWDAVNLKWFANPVNPDPNIWINYRGELFPNATEPVPPVGHVKSKWWMPTGYAVIAPPTGDIPIAPTPVLTATLNPTNNKQVVNTWTNGLAGGVIDMYSREYTQANGNVPFRTFDASLGERTSGDLLPGDKEFWVIQRHPNYRDSAESNHAFVTVPDPTVTTAKAVNLVVHSTTTSVAQTWIRDQIASIPNVTVTLRNETTVTIAQMEAADLTIIPNGLADYAGLRDRLGIANIKNVTKGIMLCSTNASAYRDMLGMASGSGGSGTLTSEYIAPDSASTSLVGNLAEGTVQLYEATGAPAPIYITVANQLGAGVRKLTFTGSSANFTRSFAYEVGATLADAVVDAGGAVTTPATTAKGRRIYRYLSDSTNSTAVPLPALSTLVKAAATWAGKFTDEAVPPTGGSQWPRIILGSPKPAVPGGGIPWIPPTGPGHFSDQWDEARKRVDTYKGPLDPESTQMAQQLVEQAAVFTHAGWNSTTYNAHYWQVTPDTPTMPVAWFPWRTTEIKRPMWDNFKHCQVPNNIFPSAGIDSAVIIHNPTTRQLWEFWKFTMDPARVNADRQTRTYDPAWTEPGSDVQAAFGGYIHDTKQNIGRFENIGGLTYGTAASSLSYLAFAVAVSDILNEAINHAINLQVIRGRTSFSYPALRTDASGGLIRHGQRVRLPIANDYFNSTSYPGMTMIGRFVARAMQLYGAVVTDRSGALTIAAESGSVGMAANGTYTNPWTALRTQYAGGAPSYEILKNFPWIECEFLPSNWGQGITVAQTLPSTATSRQYPATNRYPSLTSYPIA